MDIEGAVHPSCRWLCHKCYLACRSPTSCDPLWGPSDRPVPSPMVIKYPSPYSLLKRDQPFLLRMRLFPTFLLILKSKTLGNESKIQLKTSQNAAQPTSAYRSVFLVRNSLIYLEAVYGSELGILQYLTCYVKWSQLRSLIPQKHGLETHFHRIPISHHCAHPDGRLYHRTQGLRLP